MGGLDEARTAPSAGEDATSAGLTGRQIGRYLVGQRLGSGGVADVYQAYDQVLGRSVALKLLPFSADERTLNRFRREALTAGALRHPHIVRILQVGGAQPDGLAYIAMELVQGESLAALLARRGQLNPAESCNLLEPIARALAHAHRSGIVHRDVKPGNILLQPASPGAPNSVQLESLDHPVVPLLTDFGIARALDAPELTSAGRTVGTPAYMAPEQCAGSSEIDGRADIYALGTVLYRCITGRLPFNGSTTQMLYAHVYEPLVIEDHVLHLLSPLMVDILKQSLAKQPRDRFADAEQMAAALAFAAGRRQAASPGRVDAAVEPGTATATLTAGSLPAIGAAPSSPVATTVLVAPAPRGMAAPSAVGQRPPPEGDQPAQRQPTRRRRLSVLMAAGVVTAMTVLVVGFVLVVPLANRLGGAPPTPTGSVLAVGVSGVLTDAAAAVATTAPVASAPTATVTAPPAAPPATQTPLPSPTATWTPVPTPTPVPPTPTGTASPTPTATAPPVPLAPDEELVTACASTTHEFFAGSIAQLAEPERLGFACPGSTATRTGGIYLPFERGFMLQLATDPLILVYYDGAGEWEQLVAPGQPDDSAAGGDALFGSDLFQPAGPFGLVWQDEQRRAALGYATTPDAIVFDAVQQGFPGGLLVGNLDDGAVYVFLRDRLRL